MSSEPLHLASQAFEISNDFPSNEKVYRRMPFNGVGTSVTVPFLDLKWEEIEKGLSVFRSSKSSIEDAKWAIKVVGNNQCAYEFKNALVYESSCNFYPTSTLKSGLYFDLEHSPNCCNIAHCDIKAKNLPTQKPPINERRDIRAFLATFFMDCND